MKICQVISSNLPIGRTGERRYGATELIIEEYAKNLRKLGHEVDIKYLNEVQPDEYSIVHIHVANLAIEAADRGIPYIYTTHDHHSFYYGKDSFNYQQQLEAMKRSIFSLAPAEYVVDYFDATDKLFYLRHGVDTSYYIPTYVPTIYGIEHKLLMVSNNGLASNYGIDRKGFRVAISAARELGLPITIIGTDANTKFFDLNQDLLEYDKLTVIATNITEDEKLEVMKKHSIFIHPSSLEYGVPCLAQLEAASCCMPMVATMKGINKMAGVYLLNEISKEDIISGVSYIEKNYKTLVHEMYQARDHYDWLLVVKQLEAMYNYSLQTEHLPSSEIRNKYIQAYNNTTKIW